MHLGATSGCAILPAWSKWEWLMIEEFGQNSPNHAIDMILAAYVPPAVAGFPARW